MADIAMCLNEECPLKHSCWRQLAPENPLWQSYSTFLVDWDAFYEGKGGCDFYIGANLKEKVVDT